MANKLLDFQASITDVKQVNPLFSTCKVRVLYTGKNRNMSIINKDAVEKALPTLPNIPIVGEFSEENLDYKGHGGAIDLDSYKYIHTTKPYGVVPESATYEWEEVKGRDGSIREYLVINGCYLWTGRYEEAFSVIESGKNQSMEIEITDGQWDESQDAYEIKNFIFSALCILGDDVEPAFEDANITAYSLNKDSFKEEFTRMLRELKLFTKQEDKGASEMLKELLEKYSTTVEELTAKGLDFNEISEDEIEAKIVEVLEIAEEPVAVEPIEEPVTTEEPIEEPIVVVEPIEEPVVIEPTEEPINVEAIQEELEKLRAELSSQKEELETLREFKLNTEKAEHEEKVQKLFSNFQLTEEDVKDLDIHAFSIEEIEEKCYAILGRKLASKKEFSLKAKDNGIKIDLSNSKKNEVSEDEVYGGLFKKYRN